MMVNFKSGNWKNDKANGYGLYIHKNGTRYEGEWLDDLQHGKGIETWPEGSKYVGEYFQGQKHGDGNYFWTDGSNYKGNWENNMLQGYVRNKSGNIYLVRWKNEYWKLERKLYAWIRKICLA